MFEIIGDKALGMTPNELADKCNEILKDLTPPELQDPNIIYNTKNKLVIKGKTFTTKDYLQYIKVKYWEDYLSNPTNIKAINKKIKLLIEIKYRKKLQNLDKTEVSSVKFLKDSLINEEEDKKELYTHMYLERWEDFDGGTQEKDQLIAKIIARIQIDD